MCKIITSLVCPPACLSACGLFCAEITRPMGRELRLATISIRNMSHHYGRLAFLVVGLTVTVATIVALFTLSGLMSEDFQRRLDEYGTNMTIVPKTEDLSLSYGGVSMGSVGLADRSLTDTDVDDLKTIKNSENLAVISPKIIGTTVRNREDVLVLGVNFADELRIKKWWEIGSGKKPERGHNQALAGARAASQLNLSPGSEITIAGESFKITGILDEVGSQEDLPIYIDLKVAQRLFNRPAELDIIEVAAWCQDCPIETMVGQASEKLPHAKVASVTQAARSRNKVVTQFNLFSFILSATIILVGGLIIFSSMLTAVRERRRDIGIFRAVGFRGLNILEIILFETVLLAVAGGITGYVLGLGAAALVTPSLGIAGTVEVNLTIGYFTVLGAIILTLVSTLYPALTAAKLSPMTALNDI